MASVRRATAADLDAMVAMGADMHAESPNYRDKPLNLAKVRGIFTHVIGSDAGAAFVAEAGGELVGMLLLVACERWFNDERYAADLILYVKPARRGTSAFRRLVEAAQAWKREQGLVELAMGISSGVHAEATVHALQKMGMRLTSYTVTDNV